LAGSEVTWQAPGKFQRLHCKQNSADVRKGASQANLLGACREANPKAAEKRTSGLQAERLYGLVSARGPEHALCLVDAAGTIAGNLDCF